MFFLKYLKLIINKQINVKCFYCCYKSKFFQISIIQYYLNYFQFLQEIGIHYDTPWFFGADRRNLPLWLLVAMRTSGLFNDISINQV